MGFLSGLIGAGVKTLLTPVAILRDVANVATGQEADATKDLLESAGKDVGNAVSDLGDGDVL